jgi:glyoxylase-like metal-dependent hydrolase (beta-lactamase superfamily II)
MALEFPCLPEWVQKLEVGRYLTNVYLIKDGSETLIIDPGGEGEKIARLLPDLNLPIKVVLTHGHADHWAGLAQLEALCPQLQVFYPALDEIFFRQPNQEFLKWLGGESLKNIGSALLAPGELRVGKIAFSIFHTPGHTPGHIALFGGGLLFSGDLVFKNGVGRTDFPRGSGEDLRLSLRKVLSFPPQTIICPGHGPLTTVEEVRLSLEI